MIGRVIRRAGWSLTVIFSVIVIVFLIQSLGDPAAATLGPRAGPEQLQQFREQHGLDKPLYAQFGSYMKGLLLEGSLGTSFRDNQPVGEVIATRLPRTMLLGAMAMFFELLLGLTIGLVAAWKRNTLVDTGLMSLAFVGLSAPTFVTGLLFLQYLAFGYGWFPVGGYGIDPLEHVQHALLPAFTLAIIGAATYSRMLRSEMIETLRTDYVRTAKAKGLAPTRVLLAHAARNALLPVVTLIGMGLPSLVAGAIITEQIYAWPGMGRLAVESISSSDTPMILGIVLMVAVAVQFGNLAADLAIAWLDPRIRARE